MKWIALIVLAFLAGAPIEAALRTRVQTETQRTSSGATRRRAPNLISISPPFGTIQGGTLVTLKGTNFVRGATVSFQGKHAVTTFLSPVVLSAVSPPHAAGIVDVNVTNPDGQSTSLLRAYTYTEQEHGPYSIDHQQPAAYQFNPRSIFVTPLPPNVSSHYLRNSDDIVRTIFGEKVTQAMITTFATNPQDYGGIPAYYSDARDPVYKWTGCTTVPRNSDFSPNGKYFHLKPGGHMNGSTGDEAWGNWDQSTELDPYHRQRWIQVYWFNSHGAVIVPAGCHARNPTEADKDSGHCVIPMLPHYCAVGYPNDDDKAYDEGPNPWSSPDVGPPAMLLRDEEIIAGTINHAIWLNTWCVSRPNTFPSFGYGPCECHNPNSCGGGQRYTSPRNRPAGAALFWIDNGYNCNSLPAWQKGLCKAMQVYGGYISDTGGSYDDEGLWPVKHEGPTAYQDAGISFPLFDWLLSQPGITCTATACYDQPNTPYHSGGMLVLRNKTKATLRWFNMPGLLGPPIHLHVIDPCVPKAMAHVHGGCP